MINKNSKIIYVGKARNLRKRLASYARFQGMEHSKTRAMVAQIEKIETILTRTEKEALILEASLIKKHHPKYNIILRDDKNYPYIKVTVHESWPRVLMARRKAKDKAKYFGPYSSVGAMWATIKLLHSLFPLRRCKGKEVKKRSRPCINFQMKRCLAPCVGKADTFVYEELVKDVILVLEGRNAEFARKLKDKMHKAVAGLCFEEAAIYRDQLSALEKTLEKQFVASSKSQHIDVFGFIRKGASVAISVITVRHGKVLGQRVFYFAEPIGEDPEILSECLKRYYEDLEIQAREVIFSFLPDDSALLVQWLSEIRQASVIFKVPERGNKRRLIDMAEANARQAFAEREKREKNWQELSLTLVKKLALTGIPHRIECLDISNISGKQAVGSLVCFMDGEKSSKNYRHFKIKTVAGPDDYRMMAEVIERRVRRGIKEDNLPDLFMVDGGKGQLNVALNQFRQFGLEHKVELVGIAKERGEEGEKLYRPGRKNPIILPRHSSVLLLLMRIRDESHRYGVTFHRKLRHKSSFASELDMIPGVGPGRKKKLLRYFGSLKEVKNASVSELAKIPGIGQELARNIQYFFHQGG
ncbi:MAG: excinuclease ABC subunit UvrC [Desulfobulbaceae bacterium]|nr:excinuclease ABC subunit UvrC [Desulfobulbaceae bacterium]